jgi:hypothetical protein
MGWFFALQQIKQCIGKSKHRRSIQAGTCNTRISAKGKESPVNQRHTVQQKESFVVIHKGGKDKKDWEILYEGSIGVEIDFYFDDFSVGKWLRQCLPRSLRRPPEPWALALGGIMI